VQINLFFTGIFKFIDKKIMFVFLAIDEKSLLLLKLLSIIDMPSIPNIPGTIHAH